MTNACFRLLLAFTLAAVANAGPIYSILPGPVSFLDALGRVPAELNLPVTLQLPPSSTPEDVAGFIPADPITAGGLEQLEQGDRCEGCNVGEEPPIPEPASLTMAVIGLTALFILRQRKTRLGRSARS
jgi:hypothetical protein